LSSRNMRAVQTGIEQVASRLGCRMADGIAERVVFRSLFPLGLTVFDPLDDDEMSGVAKVSHASARQEYRQLVDALNLPIRERAAERKQARDEWSARSGEAPDFNHLAPGR
ncbi:MAG: division plane positioning ATPase MipZ, partial [Cucumibacter sp.]